MTASCKVPAGVEPYWLAKAAGANVDERGWGLMVGDVLTVNGITQAALNAALASYDADEVSREQYRLRRKVDYIADLGKSSPPTFEDTAGDVLDAIIGQLALLVPEAQRTPDFAALVERVLAIKARYPKSEGTP